MSQVMVVAFAVYAGLYSSRNIPISSMLLVLIMAPQISATLAERAASPETSPVFATAGPASKRLRCVQAQPNRACEAMSGRFWWSCWACGPAAIRANRFTNGDRRSLRWKTVSSQGSGFPDGQPYS